MGLSGRKTGHITSIPAAGLHEKTNCEQIMKSARNRREIPYLGELHFDGEKCTPGGIEKRSNKIVKLKIILRKFEIC